MIDNTQYPCSVCQKEVKHDAIQCDICQLWSHRNCVKLKKSDLVYFSQLDIYYYCPACLLIFPYATVNNDEFQFLCSNLEINQDVFYYYKQCNGLNVNCIDLYGKKVSDWDLNIDPDANFYEAINFDCKYYTEEQFFVNTKSVEGLTIIHFNARSLNQIFHQILMK